MEWNIYSVSGDKADFFFFFSLIPPLCLNETFIRIMPGTPYDMNSIIKTLFSYFSLFVCFRTLRPRTVGQRRVVFNSFSTIAANHRIPSDRNPNVDRRSVRATKLSGARRNAFRSPRSTGPARLHFIWRSWMAVLRKFVDRGLDPIYTIHSERSSRMNHSECGWVLGERSGWMFA